MSIDNLSAMKQAHVHKLYVTLNSISVGDHNQEPQYRSNVVDRIFINVSSVESQFERDKMRRFIDEYLLDNNI